jgi:flagellum-specific ATP synthase
MATITTIRSPMRFAARSTAISCLIAIADEGRYPAVNILASVSRLAHPVWTPDQPKLVANLRSLIARFEETRELRLMGGYAPGADLVLDKAIKSVPRLYEAMTQSPDGPRCEDPFIDLAAALRNDAKSPEA